MKFSIRDLLLVTVIVALAVGWAVDHWRQEAGINRWKKRVDDVNFQLKQATGGTMVWGNSEPEKAEPVHEWGNSEPEKADPVHVVESRAFKRTYTSDVLNGRLEATPKWRDGDENPPVSISRALRIAEEEAAAIPADEHFQRNLESASLVKVGKDWLWEVRYVWDLKVGGSSGISDNFVVVILMDGSVVKPTVEP